MNVALLLVLFIASQMAPTSARELSFEVGSEKVTFTRMASGGWTTVFPGQEEASTFTVEGNRMMLVNSTRPNQPKELDVTLLVEVPDPTPANFWQTLQTAEPRRVQLGTAITIEHDAARKQIRFSQKLGPLSGVPAVITYR
ncbi:MAG: hypothetical protein AAGK14_08240 [Verrucomicrobiota bacterium]